MSMRQDVYELFQVVIQFGAILAVAVLFFRKLNPFAAPRGSLERREVFALWGKVALATLPAAAAGFFLDDLLSAYLFRPEVVAGALIFYGVLFLLPAFKKEKAGQLTAKTAFAVGCFQVLSLVPGTSRSGSTILGGMACGLSRPTAAEFSFFLGIPTMFGACLLKTAKFCAAGGRLSCLEAALFLAGTLTAFLVSLAVIRFLLDFVRRHSFAPFGVYRILLGGAVLCRTLLF